MLSDPESANATAWVLRSAKPSWSITDLSSRPPGPWQSVHKELRFGDSRMLTIVTDDSLS